MRLLGIRTGPDDVSIVVRGLRSMDPQWSCSTTLCVASSLAGSLPIPRSPNRTGSQRRLPYVVLTAWLNPGADIGKALDHATNLLIQECVKKGVTNILVAHEPQPVKISADSGSLMPAVPNHWVTSGDLHASPGPHSRAAPH